MAAIVATDWTVTASNGNIRYTGDDHGGAAPSYSTVLELRRWLQGLSDDPEWVVASSDEIDITQLDPAKRFTNNFINLKGIYNLDDAAVEHLYDGSITQGTGGSEVFYDGIVNFGNQGVVVQLAQDGAVLADDFWNYDVGGSDDASSGAAFMTDGTATFVIDEFIGYVIVNVTDGSKALITSNTGTTVLGTLYGGTGDNWDSGDDYLISRGLNADASQGISHRFLVKVRTAGADVDGRRLIGTCRTYEKTFKEFKIAGGTGRGNNTLALDDADDINNNLAWATVNAYADVINLTEGYLGLDVNNDTVNEFYYSEWDRGARTINQFIEYQKLITSDRSAYTLWGLNGELFRGITHEIDVDGGTGTWGSAAANLQAEPLSWTGGTGQLMAVDNETGSSTTKLWMQLLTGVVPSNNDTITGGTSSATADAELTGGVILERPISTPYVGVATGSALIGSYGFSLETDDLGVNDRVVNLAGVTIPPPNNVTNTAAGLISGEDYVMVTPWDGSTTDSEGKPAIQIDFFSNTSLLNGAAVASIEVDEAIPTWVPDTGWLRVITDAGRNQLCVYTSVDRVTKIFTISPTEDFSSDNASAANDIYPTPIDKLAGATSEAWTAVHTSDDDFVLIVRDGDTTPIEEYKVGITFEANDQTFNVIRNSDL